MSAPLTGGLGGASGALGIASAATSLAGGIGSLFVGFRQARELEKRAIREARRIRRAGDRVLGAQTAAYAHAGVTQQGTPQDVRNDTISEIEREVFLSTEGFEVAANRVINEGLLSLADSLSSSASSLAGAGTSKKVVTTSTPGSSTTLLGRNTSGSLGGSIYRTNLTLGP